MKTLGIKRKYEALDYATKNLPPNKKKEVRKRKKRKRIKEKLGKGMKKG